MEESIKITLPESWNEVSLGTYMELASISSEEDNLSRIIKFISILSDVDPEEIKKVPTSELSKIGEAIEWAGSLPSSEFKHIITIDGEQYGLIPSFSDLSVGEWIDLESYGENILENMHIVMAILYRPLITALNDRARFIDKYDAESLLPRAELFKEKMNVNDVYGAMLFFSSIGGICTKNLAGFSEKIQNLQTETMK